MSACRSLGDETDRIAVSAERQEQRRGVDGDYGRMLLC
jgi:hypothetical protein